MKHVPLSEVKDNVSKSLHVVEHEEMVIARHGRPAGILIGFTSEDGWFECRLEHNPRCVRRIEAARKSLRGGRGVRLEDIDGS